MFNLRQPTDDAQVGRTSGALDWRQSRGEIQRTNKSQFVWEFNSSDVCNDFITIQYSSALNQYQKVTVDGATVALNNWDAGVFETEGVFRKVETDWKKVYLCRTGKSFQ